MALIALEGVSRHFRMGSETIRALDDISLSILDGELVSIMGPSGCGKSTLMNILGLLDGLDAGTYRLSETDVGSLDDDKRAQLRNQKIGFVFQSFNLLPRLSALRNVEMPMVYSASYDQGFSREKIRNQAIEALRRVGLEDRMEHAPNELSGGQRQRLAIARALVNNPSLVLADEPTGNLDSKSGAEILQLFQTLHRQGTTLVIVTHDPTVAAQAERRIVMKDGKIINHAA